MQRDAKGCWSRERGPSLGEQQGTPSGGREVHAETSRTGWAWAGAGMHLRQTEGSEQGPGSDLLQDGWRAEAVSVVKAQRPAGVG